MKRALVTGCSGLIGSHMAHRLVKEGYHVIGASRHAPATIRAHQYVEVDLREVMPSDPIFRDIDAIYNFACEVGGLGYLANKSNEVEIMRNSTLIDMAVLEGVRHRQQLGAAPPKVFFASSACVYNVPGKRFYAETDAYPANCNNPFARQKLFSEQLYQAYARNYGLDIRIGRLFNTYGIGMAWRGGREKSVAALCRKMAEVDNAGVIDVWGHGEQTRSYMHVDDAVEGIWRVMQHSAGVHEPLNIGPAQEVTINDLIQVLMGISGKTVFKKYGDGPIGVSKICSDNTHIRAKLGWEPSITIEEGLPAVYEWVKNQVLTARAKT